VTAVNDGSRDTREVGGGAMSAVNIGTCVAALTVQTAKSVAPVATALTTGSGVYPRWPKGSSAHNASSNPDFEPV